jgi:hypothetical protein
MSRILDWVKTHKLNFILLLIICWLIYRQNFRSPIVPLSQRKSSTLEMAETLPISTKKGSFYFPEPAPAPEAENRLVIKESTLSLLVKNVVETQKAISQKAQEFGGYLVQSNISHPEETEATSGWITVRIPREKLDEALNYFRGLAVKVVSETISGQDVTDEYVDIEARLATLLKTKMKFEEILAKAEKVQDILEVQRELINLQEQIDNLKGRQNYLEKSAQVSRVTIYLATDELALPYVPTESWRPQVIFKQAVRSLIGALRKFGTLIIWFAVYSVVWLPILAIYLIIRHWRRKSS